MSRLVIDAQRRHDTVPQNVRGAHRRRDDFFAAMPHLEVKMMHTLQESAQEDENEDQMRRGSFSFDVKNGHRNARCDEEQSVEQPRKFGKSVKYAKLKRWLYEVRNAKSGWDSDFSPTQVNDGFKRGNAPSTIFHLLRNSSDFSCTETVSLSWTRTQN